MKDLAPSLALLRSALDRVASEGRAVRFWLRDDDASAPHPPLDRLLRLLETYRVPATLAVIPASTGQELADRIDGLAKVVVAVHGWSHANHAPPSAKKQELGAHRPLQSVVAELDAGLSRLRSLYGDRVLPMLVPPWNRIDGTVVDALPALGFTILSTFGPPRPAPLAVLNGTVDLMDWHGTRGCRDAATLVREIIVQLEATSPPVELLTHHLVHDEACWAFLEALFDLTADHPGVRWDTAADLANVPINR